MAMISASASLLKEILGERLDEEANDVLDILMTAVERTTRMVTSLYRCSQVDARAPSLATVDLNRIVEELKGVQLSAELRESHGTIDVPERLHVVVGDEMQILQLMQNLLTNGLKYHRTGVAPVVTVRSRDAGADRVRIEVEDNGIGIKEADREKVFGMFKRLDNTRDDEGLGIGLALCRKVAERHGGRIGVTSVYGSGSTLWVELPTVHG
jgi:signal transduction histidine kinase